MISSILQGDVLDLLRKLGFNCDIVKGSVRVCEYPGSTTVVLLTDRPADEPLPAERLFGLKLELENSGLMSREEFDSWAERRSKTNSANGSAGAGTKPRRRQALRNAHRSSGD